MLKRLLGKGDGDAEGICQISKVLQDSSVGVAGLLLICMQRWQLGFERGLCAASYDPVQDLLAVATNNGNFTM